VGLADTRLRRELLRELVKRPVESTLLDIKVVSAIVYLSGELRPVRGETVDLRKECQLIEEMALGFKGVRGIVNLLKLPL